VELLLGQEDVNPDMSNTGGRIPLTRAAQKGDDGALKPLLEREGVNPHMSDKPGHTLLSWAA